MKSLALVNGDLSVGAGGYQTVTGSARIRQDLALALGEAVGNDRFHPDWGSVLMNFIGQPIDDTTKFNVRSEVARVIQQYIDVQARGVFQKGLSRDRQTASTGDIVIGVADIQAEVLYDTVKITANLQTLAGRTISIKRTVTV